MKTRITNKGIDLLSKLKKFKIQRRRNQVFDCFYMHAHHTNKTHILVKKATILKQFEKLALLTTSKGNAGLFEVGIAHQIEDFPQVTYLLEHMNEIFIKIKGSGTRPLQESDLEIYSNHIDQYKQGDDSIIDFVNSNQFWQRTGVLCKLSIQSSEDVQNSLLELKETLNAVD